MNRRHCLLLLSAGLLPASAARLLPASAAAEVAGGLVARVLDGDTFMLGGGDEVRLAGVLAPKPWQLPAQAGPAAAALPARATAALDAMAHGRSVTLAFDARPRDRNDRLLAQVERDDGLWLEGELLRRGLVRVCTSPDNRARADAMLALEAAARARRQGLWAVPEFRVLDAEAAARFVGSFQIVEGSVRDLGQGREQTYLHFGASRRASLTLSIALAERRRFQAAGRSPRTLVGRRLRVRGWIQALGGPVIEATHPEQIEVLD